MDEIEFCKRQAKACLLFLVLLPVGVVVAVLWVYGF
jgi:hypothetical protein